MQLLTLDIVADAIANIDYDDRDTWVSVGMSLKSEFDDAAFSIWDQWGSQHKKYNANNAKSVWKSFKTGGISIGTFIHLAKESGFSFPREELSDEEKTRRKEEAKRRRIEQERIQAERVEQDKKNAEEAAQKAAEMWAKLPDKGHSVYLQVKKSDGYGLKFTPEGSAVAKVQDIDNKIHGIQFLLPDGRKQFWPVNMRVTSHYHPIGNISDSKHNCIGICEGYATGDTIHQAASIPLFVAFNAGNLSAVSKVVRERYPDHDIIIFADDDYQTKNNPGIAKAKKAAKEIKGKILIPEFSFREDDDWTDFNDLADVEGLGVVRDQILPMIYALPEKNKKGSAFEVPVGQEWQWKFSRTQSGNPRADVNNARLVLANDDRWDGVLAYCDFNCAVMKIKPPPFEDNAETGEWSDADTARLRCWLAEHHDFSPKTNDVDDAVLVAAQAKRFHPVREYLNGLVWDGEERVDTWLMDLMGVKFTLYNVAVGKKWLLGAVARIFQPGCKMDNVLIFEGGQGKGKSTSLKILGGDWFSDTHFELGTKDAYQQMRGVWIYEMAELDAFNKAESTKAKAFFTAQEDNYRPSYGRRNVRIQRQCVIAGSTNQDHYLKDVTGNRRYWPVRCTEIDLEGLRDVRDQLWAEAVHRYKDDQSWKVQPEEFECFAEAQEERFLSDGWEDDIVDWLDNAANKFINLFTLGQIMREGLDMITKDINPPSQTRVGNIMKRLGWNKVRRRRDLDNTGVKKPMWFYERPAAEQMADADTGDPD